MATDQKTDSPVETVEKERGATDGRPADTLTITDNRTGQTYDVDLTDGTIRDLIAYLSHPTQVPLPRVSQGDREGTQTGR